MTPTFPQLSRKPALKTRETRIDTTLRDPMENGAEATRPRPGRLRKQWDVSINFLTPADKTLLDNFVDKVVMGGGNNFLFPDTRDPKNPVNYNVRFSTLPSYVDTGSVQGNGPSYNGQNCTFSIREL